MATETLEAPPVKAEATMTAREQVIAFENQAQAERKARLESDVSKLSVADVTDEPLPEPPLEDKAAADAEAASEAAKVAAEEEAENNETAEVPRNEKGHFIVRPKRFNDLTADRAKLRPPQS